MCVSVANSLNKGQDALKPSIDGDLDALRETVVSEVGSNEAIYDAGRKRAAVHHGELLPGERRLVETIFRDRDSGVNILAATSTLAQGLNLPCEVVILAGTDRLDDTDPEEKTRSSLMPYEILNALGRAGRAGQAATGLSVVVPGIPIGCDLETRKVPDNTDLPVIFSEDDQCLPLIDPLTTLFDQIEVSGASGEEAEYLLRRLAVSLGAERDGVETFDSLTRRSFGFHLKAKLNSSAAETWLSSRRATLATALAKATPISALPWQEELAAKTGASSEFVASLVEAYGAAPKDGIDASTWVTWLLRQLDPKSDDFDFFLRPDTLSRVFGRAYTRQSTPHKQRQLGLEGVLQILGLWFAGKALVDLEAKIAEFIAKHEGEVARPTKRDPKAKRARRFSIRLAPDLGFLCGVLNQIAKRIAQDQGQVPPPMTGFLGQLVRRGFQTPYHFALSREIPNASRPIVQLHYEAVASRLDRRPTDDWEAVREKLAHAEAALAFGDLSMDFASTQEQQTQAITVDDV